MLSAAAASLCTPKAANMRELQVGGANGVAAVGGAAVNLASGAWFEAATIRMGVDAEYCIAARSWRYWSSCWGPTNCPVASTSPTGMTLDQYVQACWQRY